MPMRKRKLAARPRARKQTSSRVSTIAARLMNLATDAKLHGFENVLVPIKDVQAVAASALTQDERKGQ